MRPRRTKLEVAHRMLQLMFTAHRAKWCGNRTEGVRASVTRYELQAAAEICTCRTLNYRCTGCAVPGATISAVQTFGTHWAMAPLMAFTAVGTVMARVVTVNRRLRKLMHYLFIDVSADPVVYCLLPWHCGL
jgi:hypothetical protein